MVRILHGDWLIRLGENRLDQSSRTFGGYAICIKLNIVGCGLKTVVCFHAPYDIVL